MLDQGRAFGWEPPWFNEQEINTEVWSLMRTAARNAKLTKPRVEARQIPSAEARAPERLKPPGVGIRVEPWP